MTLYDSEGRRKYMNQAERLRFFEATKMFCTKKKLFCQLLYYTGARISEVYNLTTANIDIANGMVVIETVKKRKSRNFREFPVPDELLKDLVDYIGNHNYAEEFGRD